MLRAGVRCRSPPQSFCIENYKTIGEMIMKQMPKAVFVMENGRYTEITNEEHCHRQAKDADYRNYK